MGKKTSLVRAVQQCTRCTELSETRSQPVLGEGPVPCSIVFLGETPGFNEDREGRPFCGTCGTILETSASAVGLRRKHDYHLLNVLKCRLPQNRAPSPQELKNCRPYLEQQLRVLKPVVVLALGKYAQAYVLNQDPKKTFVTDNMGLVIRHPNFYAVLSCNPRFTSVSPQILKAFRHHLLVTKQIAQGKEPQCTVLNAT